MSNTKTKPKTIVTVERNALVIWTITNNPSDYPGYYVARPHVVGQGGKTFVGLDVITALSLDALRDHLQTMNPTLIRFPRDVSDDPVIVETWM